MNTERNEKESNNSQDLKPLDCNKNCGECEHKKHNRLWKYDYCDITQKEIELK